MSNWLTGLSSVVRHAASAAVRCHARSARSALSAWQVWVILGLSGYPVRLFMVLAATCRNATNVATLWNTVKALSVTGLRPIRWRLPSWAVAGLPAATGCRGHTVRRPPRPLRFVCLGRKRLSGMSIRHWAGLAVQAPINFGRQAWQ